MRSEQKKVAVVDTGLIIEYLTIDSENTKQKGYKEFLDKNLFRNKQISQIYISFLTKTELLYIVCRTKGWSKAEEIVEHIVSNFAIIRDKEIDELAALIKCKIPVALPDCFNLSIAVLYGIPVYFLEEREFTKEISSLIKSELKVNLKLLGKME